MNKHKTVCIAGGHLSPAVAIAEAIQKYPDTTIMFIGRTSAFGKKEEEVSTEKIVFQRFTEKIYLLDIQRVSILKPMRFVQFITAVFQCRRYYSQHKPDVLVLFGGYVGLICGIAGVMQGIPMVLHEQTHNLGISNKVLSLFAKKVCVSFSDMATNSRVYTGFPLREELFHPPEKSSINIPPNQKILYITGGTTGAVSLNEKLFPLIPDLISTFAIVHQTGQLSYEQANKVRENLSDSQKKLYTVIPYIDPKDVAWLLYNSSLVIARGGANTVYELAVTKTPAIVVPLPWSAADEQKRNATWLSSVSPAITMSQEHITKESLFETITTVTELKSENNIQVPTDGSQRLVNLIFSVIS